MAKKEGSGMARKFAAAVFCLGAWHSTNSLALGLGELTLDSFLNEPLKATVDLLDTDGLHVEEIRVRLATRGDFDRLGVERSYFLTGIKFEVEMDGSHRGRIILSSDDPVLEPYLDFIIEARWPAGRLLREYTVLVDPPVFKQSTTVISASDKVNAPDGGASTAAAQKKTTSEVTSRSGTHVTMAQGDTGAAMPKRSYNSGAADAPTSGDKYMISRDDTLWEIAEAARPQGASVHQTMLDIQRLNPNAFIDGNINRIKAGYIIYLPDSNDISSEDLDSALQEVKKQNEDWQEGRESEAYTGGGPSLRISADPDPSSGNDSTRGGSASSGGAVAESGLTGAQEALQRSELERADAEQRVTEMQEQLKTLQQIVNLKDEQIAALQGALAEGGAELPAGAVVDEAGDDFASEIDEIPGGVDEAAAAGLLADGSEGELFESTEAVAEAEAEESVSASAPAKMLKLPSATTPKKPPGFFESYWQYLAGGAAILAALVWALMRRRKDEEDDFDFDEDEVFADVELQQDELEVEADVDAAIDPDLEVTIEEDLYPEELSATKPDSQGYGESNHDQYASDGNVADVLGEVEILISYGRDSQAVELLRDAIAKDPGNSDYRLKLLTVYTEAGDRDKALAQFNEVQAMGDAVVTAKANSIMNQGAVAPPAPEEEEMSLDLELDDLQIESDDTLEADFTGLEIEEEGTGFGDELDLSADFSDQDLAEEEDEEEGAMVFAAEGNEMSTKLDLARAYLDMGDEDGARQILEEVATEGSGDQQAEAEGLMQRLG
jgi:pilus assembly protein FimV